MNQFDVLVVGAGPAGLFTARHLDPALRVLIIDRQEFPPTKPCGELLVDHAYQSIVGLDPPDSIFAAPGEVEMRLIDRDSGSPPRITGTAHTLDRKALSRWLRSLVGPNVVFRERTRFLTCETHGDGCSVAMRRGDGQHEQTTATCVVGADGFASAVRRAACATRPGFVEAVQHIYTAARPPAAAEFILDRTLAPGYYLWAFPRGDNRILVGCAGNADTFRKAFAWARNEYQTSRAPLRKERHPITRINSLREVETGRGNLILVGEAAGFVRPASGEGFSFAFESAKAAAAAINTEPHSPADRYKEACRPILDALHAEFNRGR
jgi:flavin-dependent dehydrogenase